MTVKSCSKMTMLSPSNLLQALARHGVRVYLRQGRLYMRHSWPDVRQAPPEALDLLRVLKAIRDAVKEYLRSLEAGAGPDPAGIDPPASLRPDGTCYTCGGSRWWVSVRGILVYGTCHPPAAPELAARWIGPEEAEGLKKAARADAGTRRKEIPRGMPAAGYETRPWIPGREIDWLWDNARPATKKRSPVLEYIRGRVEGRMPPPNPGPAAAPYAADPPPGVPDPMDYRWNSERQEWVHEPG